MIKKLASNWFSYWLIIFLVVFSAALLLRNSFGYLDPDFGWHYQIGREIWQSRQVPTIEQHLFPLAGQAWVDHEWLTNLVIFILTEWGGYALVSLFFAAIILATWWLLARSTIRDWLSGRADSLFFWILLIFGLQACLSHLGVRVQEISVLFLLILVNQLIKVSRRKFWQSWEMVVMPIFFWLWACLHGGFLIGLATLLTWVVFRLALYLVKQRLSWSISPANLLPFRAIVQSGLLFGLAVLATCLTPYGWKLYGFLADYQSNTAYLSLIQEWQPITEDLLSWRMLYCLLFGLALILLVIHWHWRKQQASDRQVIKWLWQQDWWPLVFSLALFVASWRSLRHFPLFVVVSLPWLAGFYCRSWRGGKFQPDKWPAYLKWFLILSLVLATSAIIWGTRWTNQPEAAYCAKYPCAAINYLQQSPYRSWPTLVDYGWGGYFDWQWPEKQLFIDGRLPQYWWRDRTMIEHYSRFFVESDVRQALDDYDLAVVVMGQPVIKHFNWLEVWLLGAGQKVNDYDSGPEIMRRVMLKLPNWRMVYSDTAATVYVRQ